MSPKQPPPPPLNTPQAASGGGHSAQGGGGGRWITPTRMNKLFMLPTPDAGLGQDSKHNQQQTRPVPADTVIGLLGFQSEQGGGAGSADARPGVVGAGGGGETPARTSRAEGGVVGPEGLRGRPWPVTVTRRMGTWALGRLWPETWVPATSPHLSPQPWPGGPGSRPHWTEATGTKWRGPWQQSLGGPGWAGASIACAWRGRSAHSLPDPPTGRTPLPLAAEAPGAAMATSFTVTLRRPV